MEKEELVGMAIMGSLVLDVGAVVNVRMTSQIRIKRSFVTKDL